MPPGTEALKARWRLPVLALLASALTACGGGGGGSGGDPPAPVVTLSAAPSSVTTGGSATLSWTTSDATDCTATGGWSGVRATSGSEGTGALGSSTTYTLTCNGPGGTGSDSATVTVSSAPVPTLSLTATPTTVTSGGASTLSWTSANATGCTASGGWTGPRATSGSQSSGGLVADTTFTLGCTGPGGSVSRTVTVTVTSAPPTPTVSIAAAPGTIVAGASSTLSWSSTDATTCTASGGWSGGRGTSGSLAVSPAVTTSYALSCTGAGGTASASTTVTVTAPPVPTVNLTATPATISGSGAATLAWTTTNATGCTATGDWTGTRATGGSESTGTLTSSKSYTLTCTGTGGSASDSATVTVTPPAPTVNLAASPASISSGSSSTLSWTTSNATGCTASGGWSGARGTASSESTGALTATTTFTLTCSGPGGSGSDSATVTVTGGGGALFPLRVEPGKRYLVTASGAPFLVQGDAPWLLISNLTREDVITYLDDRQAKGVNTLLVELIERNHSVNQPANFYGDPPFAPDPGEFAVPPEDAYFDHAEWVIGQARQRGMLVLLTPAYLGFAGRETGWYPAMGRAGNALLRQYGQYVANRFKDYDNVLWVHGGDYNASDRTRVRAVKDGILDVETESLHTFHGSRGTSALGWAGTTDPWVQVNNVYADENTVIAESQVEWERPGTMPYFLIEGDYEDEASTPLETRQQAWQAVLSGAAGQVTGQESIWLFEPGVWQTKLNTEGARTLKFLRDLLEDYSWWTLVPDFGNAFLTAGAGTGAARAPAAKAADGSFAFIYTRDVRDLTVDMGAMSPSEVQARWYDPTNGTFTAVAGSPFAPAGSRVFRPTGTNALGRSDWVLVLDALP
ncbi:MAG: DUF4038 domain-containing protein [Gammaproteobacteria bacterium]|nr:DUF4038 domain-containing protein [Gammaproteobacteria bacterium]